MIDTKVVKTDKNSYHVYLIDRDENKVIRRAAAVGKRGYVIWWDLETDPDIIDSAFGDGVMKLNWNKFKLYFMGTKKSKKEEKKDE